MAIKVIWSHSQSSEARETTSYVLCGFFLFLVQKNKQNKTKQRASQDIISHHKNICPLLLTTQFAVG